jgi:hypothetical protein
MDHTGGIDKLAAWRRRMGLPIVLHPGGLGTPPTAHPGGHAGVGYPLCSRP